MPLWEVYAQWGWGTTDGAQALDLLKGFGSVTVLNGHIHQIDAEDRGEHHVPHRAFDGLSATRAGHCAEGRARWSCQRINYGACSGLTSVNYTEVDHHLALFDSTLA